MGGEEQLKKLEDDIAKLNALFQDVKSNNALEFNDYGAQK